MLFTYCDSRFYAYRSNLLRLLLVSSFLAHAHAGLHGPHMAPAHRVLLSVPKKATHP